MADDDEKKENEENEELEGEEGEDGEEGEGGSKKKKKLTKKKKIIIIGGAVVVLIIIGVVVMMLMGGGDKDALKEGDPNKDAQLGKHGKFEESVYLQMPDITVNLNSKSRRPHFINLKITLELGGKDDLPIVESQMPKIIDSFNTYLREIRREDLQGSAGLYRLEHELMLRLEKTLVQGKVTDILFREVIIQ